jgi:hypothetical protein
MRHQSSAVWANLLFKDPSGNAVPRVPELFACGSTSAVRYPFANAIAEGKTNEQQRGEREQL